MWKPIRSILRRSVRTLASAGIIPAKGAARWLYLAEKGHFPDIEHPKDFNEKILWLEFNSDTSRWPPLADKIEVRDYVEKRGLGDYLIPLLKVYDSADDIKLEELPEQFVLKLNNGYACNLIVTDKSLLDESKVGAKARRWLEKRFGKADAEPHYLRIKPRVFAEELLPLKDNELHKDYKFHCFDGRPLYCLVCDDRDRSNFHCMLSLYRLPEWQNIPEAVVESERSKKIAAVPKNLDKMMEIASRLSEGFPFVRVDLYEIDDKIYFGELTFTPASGRIKYFSNRYLKILGDHTKLPANG